jgi:hypothetical protein
MILKNITVLIAAYCCQRVTFQQECKKLITVRIVVGLELLSNIHV